MGNGATMNVSRKNPRTSRKTKHDRRSLHLGFDIWLLVAVFTLLIFGLVMVYSSSTDYSLVVLKEAPSYMFKRQLLFAGAGIAAAAFLTWLDYHTLKKFAVPILIVTIILLASVLLVNEVINNAARTIFHMRE